MNNTFNTKRFGLLIKKAMLEKPAQTYGFMGLLLLLVLILYTIAKAVSGFGTAQNLTFIFGLPGGSFFLASFVFGYFSSYANGSSFLTLPASNFEKWLCAVLFTGIIYPAVFLLFYRFIDSSFVGIYHHSLDPSAPFYREKYDAVYLFSFNGGIAWKVYPIFFFATTSMLLGALYFNKTALVKTAITLSLLLLLIFGLNWLIAIALFGSVRETAPFLHVTIPAGKEEGTLELPSRAADIFYYSIWYVFPAILLLLSFTRLREKEF